LQPDDPLFRSASILPFNTMTMPRASVDANHNGINQTLRLRDSAMVLDLNRIHAKGYTDNVVDLHGWEAKPPSPRTQKALQQLACLGNSTEFARLAMVYQDSSEEMQQRPARSSPNWTRHPVGTVYTFLHDRVQEAAYSLIPEGERSATHLRIGRLLASGTAPAEIEEKIFEIVNQLNVALSLLLRMRNVSGRRIESHCG